MPVSMFTPRLYFAELGGEMVCVGSDGYAGPYYASESLTLPHGFDPVGMSLPAVERAQAEASRARTADFLARRRALLAGGGT
jgi:hypothetical protein